MKSPPLFLSAFLAAPVLLCAAASSAVAVDSPINLGAATPEGFNDPAHVYFFRYQAYLRKNGLDGLDAAAWKALDPSARAAKVNAGEHWLRDKFSVLMTATNLSPTDSALLSAVWGKDVAAAAGEVSEALQIGDPAQIRAAREKVKGLVKSIGRASLDWSAIFDGASPGAVVAPNMPDPLALKKPAGFLESLNSPAVRAPLASKATFVEFLQKKNVPADAYPALVAMYDVLTKAREPEKSQVAHLLPTVVKFLEDGKQIRDAEVPRALAFAASDEYGNPNYVGITSLASNSDSVAVGSVLAHEFEHVYDQYTGRFYTLDSELRGFKTNVMFLDIMKKEPTLSKKLTELLNSDDDATRSFFRDHAQVDAAFAQSPQAFAAMVAYGHGYAFYWQGVATGIDGWNRLSLREATDSDMGLQRQLSGHQAMLALQQKEVAVLQARLSILSDSTQTPSSQRNDLDIQKTAKDLAAAQRASAELSGQISIERVALDRMVRERSWLDKHAAEAGQSPPLYDLNLPVGPDYVGGN